MEIEDWIEIKFNLQNIPPSTRINYLRDIFNSLDKKKDKEMVGPAASYTRQVVGLRDIRFAQSLLFFLVHW